MMSQHRSISRGLSTYWAGVFEESVGFCLYPSQKQLHTLESEAYINREQTAPRMLNSDRDALFARSGPILVHPGYKQTLLDPVQFCTASVYSGTFDSIGMAGFGTYILPYKVKYEGQLFDGQFHGNGVIQYPTGAKFEGCWDAGTMTKYRYIFTDDLMHEDGWLYCQHPDRSFHISEMEGLRPVGKELLTNSYTARSIPKGCYDTCDGFYDPNLKCVISASDCKTVIRIPTSSEEKWIMKNCRKAWDEPVGYKPELFEKWTSGLKAERFPSEEFTIDRKVDIYKSAGVMESSSLLY